MTTTDHKAKAKEKAHTKDLIDTTETNAGTIPPNARIIPPITTNHMARAKKRVRTRDLIETLKMIVGAVMASDGEILMITIVNRSTEALTIEAEEDAFVNLNIRVRKHATNLIVNNAN